MLINLRNALMAGKRLPYDAEVEYLESTGTQYIDTGYVPATTFAFELTYSLASVGTSNNFVFGFGGGGNGVFANLRSSATFAYGSISQSIALSTLGLGNTNVHVIRGAGGNFYFDGVLGFTGNTAFTSSRSFMLFGRNSSTIALGSIRIYGCKIYDGNGTLVRDFIPVRKGTVGYMYDRVSGKLFGNAGTGDFVLGPDVVPVEYIESHGTEWIDTGFNITNAASFAYNVKFALATTITHSEPRVFSNEGAGSGAYYDVYFVTSDNRLFMRHSGTSVQIARRDVPIVSTMDEYGVYRGYYEDTPQTPLYETTRAFVAPTIDRDYRIFSRGNNTSSNYLWEGKLYWLNFTKNGEPHRRYRPVRVGSGSTWEGAMMDILTRKVYRNAGTGAFSYGNDLKYPIPAS